MPEKTHQMPWYALFSLSDAGTLAVLVLKLTRACDRRETSLCSLSDAGF